MTKVLLFCVLMLGALQSFSQEKMNIDSSFQVFIIKPGEKCISKQLLQKFGSLQLLDTTKKVDGFFIFLNDQSAVLQAINKSNIVTTSTRNVLMQADNDETILIQAFYIKDKEKVYAPMLFLKIGCKEE